MARGGTRKGAGRPALPASEKRVILTGRVPPDLADWLRAEAAERDQSIGEVLTSILLAVRGGDVPALPPVTSVTGADVMAQAAPIIAAVEKFGAHARQLLPTIPPAEAEEAANALWTVIEALGSALNAPHADLMRKAKGR
ncbi:MAG: hypothetical protein FJ029_13060 [Actinobacteria bacterium]|nr:hypothetical protein [Actinomycetota bacterium]